MAVKAPLATIYDGIEKTVRSACVPPEQFDKGLAAFLEKYGSRRERTDDEYHWIMTCVVFYSGMNARTVTNKLESIQEHLYGIRKVAQYDERTVERLLDDPGMIRHAMKTRAAIVNARRFEAIAAQFGSFQKYLDSFHTDASFENVMRLRDSLKAQFKMLGPRTAYHFMTDIGMPVLKPDRVVVRVLGRLGLLNKSTDEDEVLTDAVTVGRQIALESGKTIREVDIVLALFGQVAGNVSFGLREGICLEREPKCELCKVQALCEYFCDSGRSGPEVARDHKLQ